MDTPVTTAQVNSPQTNSIQSSPNLNQANSVQDSTTNSLNTSQESPQIAVSQSSSIPKQNVVPTILNCSNLLQDTAPNTCMSVCAPGLENLVNKPEYDSAHQSNSPQSTVPGCPSGKTDDSGVPSCTPSAASLPNNSQPGQLEVDAGISQVNSIVPYPKSVGPQLPKVEGGCASDSNGPSAVPLSKHSELVNRILKITQDLTKYLDNNSASSANSSAIPSTSTQMPSNPGSTQEPGNQGAVSDSQSQSNSNSNFPPVNIGACLMCGGDCDCGEPDSEEDEKGFLPPPPLSSVEVDSLFGKLKEQDKETPAEPASVINTKMHLHQKQALNWMINKENCNDLGPFWRENGPRDWYNEGTKTFTDERPTCIKGGILADDMGLGKTLTVIALIFTNHLDGKPMFMKKENTNQKKRRASKLDTDDDTEPQNKKPNLDSASNDEDEVVIVKKEGRKREKKAVAIKKRKEEIMNKKRLFEDKKKKDPGALFRQIFLPKILKKKEKQDNKKAKKEKPDSSAVQKPISIDIPQPSTSKNLPDVTLIDDDDDSGDDVAVTKATPTMPIRPSKLIIANPVPNGIAKATLIICPLSVLSNWTDQICSHVHPSVQLKVYMYYGPQRIQDLKYLRGQDIVLTTYPTLANDFRSKSSPLHKIKWLRIILDEGHAIRNKRTTLSKATLLLDAERRWVVTGTPIQNRIEDLKTIILYLRLEPFNDNQWWNMSIENLRNTKNSELADFRLNTLIKHVSIRRLKDDKVDNSKLVELPPKQVVIQDIELSGEERKMYDMMQLDGQSIIRRYIRHDSVLKHYGHCFAILTRLRQMCLHPRLCKEALKELQQALDRSKKDDAATNNNNDDDNDDEQARLIKVLMEAIAAGDSEECAICLESLSDPAITPCAHVFCCGCITDVLNSEGLAPKCPMCRAPVDEVDLLRVPEEQRNKNNETAIDVDAENSLGDSAKINALISSLEAIRDKDPSTKSVVVSQFTSFLNIVEEYLDRHGFGYLRLDGSMTLNERFKALEEFNEPGTATTVFLLSMSAGGTGINLTAASRVFLMDPAWNPAVEEQCFDRCHRMGQTKEVIITKYIVMDSVEERMLTLQEQKRQLMSQAFGAKAQSVEDRSRARVRDIAHLIGLRPLRPPQQAPNTATQ